MTVAEHCPCWLNLEKACHYCGYADDEAVDCPERDNPYELCPEDRDYFARLAELVRLVNLVDDPQALLLCEEIDTEQANDLRILLNHAVLRLATETGR